VVEDLVLFSHISVCLNSTEYEFAFASVLTLNLESWLKKKSSNAAANGDDRRRLESEEMSMDVNDDAGKNILHCVQPCKDGAV
jgi:hypothetical protein